MSVVTPAAGAGAPAVSHAPPTGANGAAPAAAPVAVPPMPQGPPVPQGPPPGTVEGHPPLPGGPPPPMPSGAPPIPAAGYGTGYSPYTSYPPYQQQPVAPAPAKPSGPPYGFQGMKTRTVLAEVGTDQPSPPELLKAFQPYGLVERMSIKQQDGQNVAHVMFSSVRAAERTAGLGQVQVAGTMRNVSISKQPDTPSSYDRPGLFLWVGLGERADITQDNVGNTFCSFGNVQKVELHGEDPKNNFAIVTFCTPDTATAAHAAPPKIEDVHPYIEWFHPGEQLGPSSHQPLTNPPPNDSPVLPLPEEMRKLVFRYAPSSIMMEEELTEALKPSYGGVDKIAIGIEGDFKLAYIIFSKEDSARQCKEDWDAGKLAFPDAPGLFVDWALLPSSSQATISASTPSPLVLLQFSSKEELDSIGTDALKAIFESRIGGLDSCHLRDSQAQVTFKEVSSAVTAMASLASLNIPGSPTAKYGPNPKTQAAMPTAGGSAMAGMPQMPTSGGSAATGGPGEKAEAVPKPPGLVFGGAPPANPTKNSKPPMDLAVQKRIDKVAEEYAATGTLSAEGEQIMLTENAGYLLYKTEWVKLGVTNRTSDALSKMRAAAEAAKRESAVAAGERIPATPDHMQKYKEKGQIPFTADQTILVLTENNMSFSRGLVRRLGSGANVTLTTSYSKDQVAEAFPESVAAIEELVEAGAKVGYGFEATKTAAYDELPVPESLFDAIVINFPVAKDDEKADVPDNEENQKYLRKILARCTAVLSSTGKVYVTQCDGAGYADWQTTRLGLKADSGIRLINIFPFRSIEYDGYEAVFAAFDPPARFKNASTYVFGRKRKYEAYDRLEEREIELEKIKDQKRRRRRDTSESSKDKRRKRKREKSDDDEPLMLEVKRDSDEPAEKSEKKDKREKEDKRADRDKRSDKRDRDRRRR